MKIRIIGCGAMGSALAHGLAKKNQLSVFDKLREKAETLARETGAKVVSDPVEDLSTDHIVILAVKPQDLDSASQLLRGLKRSQLLISILAGVKLETLDDFFPNVPSVRMIPNLAVKYGAGVIALVAGQDIEPLKTSIQNTFSPLGVLRWIPEEQADAVTALAGSGPAFVCTLIEAMTDAGIAMGISHSDSYEISKQMILGTISTLNASGQKPSDLKGQVTSPGGMTIAGLRKLEESAVRSGVIEAFISAYHRAKELGEQKSGQSRN